MMPYGRARIKIQMSRASSRVVILPPDPASSALFAGRGALVEKPGPCNTLNTARFFYSDMRRTGALFAGAALVAIGAALSVRPYNPDRFRTVHEFAFQCHLRSEHFLEVFGGTLAGLDWCLHNTGLSVTLCAVIGLGTFLICKSGFRKE